MKERGFWWDDFRALILRNQASNANVTYYRDKTTDPLKISIFDRGLPRRQGDANTFTGYGEHDHWKDSYVCAAAYFGGEIPIQGSDGLYDQLTNECLEKPYRGALAALTMLLEAGSLRRTDELRELFTRHGRRLPNPPAPAVAPSIGNRSDF